MPTNLFSQKNIIIFVVALVLILGGGYYFLVLNVSEEATATGVNKGLLNQKIVTFLGIKDKVDLKDSSFLHSAFYDQLVDYSEIIEMSPKRGRDNPFVPYVAP